MIIYFSGTGNSLYIARNMLGEQEKLLSISELMKKSEYVIELEKDEKLGIIFPVYFYTLPSIVKDFLEKAEIKNAGYVYSIITCGGGTGQASAVLKKLLAHKGIELAYFKELLMPDNSMLFYQIPGVEKAEGRLRDALAITEEIKKDVAAKKSVKIGNSTIISTVIGAGYKMCSGTKKFYAQENCIGCGKCEKSCPEEVIKIVDNRPVWQKDKCSKCSACINKCPVKAIQYGKGTIKRNRYVNPLV